ncbi:MAG: hypothetical protein Q8Q39_03085 [bacterium]|nr:hypothetical protein [bacterium]
MRSCLDGSKPNGTSVAVVIRKVSGFVERQQAGVFMREVAFRWHQCEPPSLPDLVFIALAGTTIVGTVALDFADDTTPFSLEKIYEFNRAETPFPFDRIRMAQYGRWMSTKPNVAAPLFYAATLYAIGLKKMLGWFELKEPIVQHMRSFGFNPVPIPSARLMPERIARKEESAYYTTDPPPTLYMVPLEHIRRALHDQVAELVRKNFCHINLGAG